jgi:hypothetical protein
VVLDETWVYSNDTVRRSWQDDDVRSVKRSSGDGGKNIDGFISNIGRIFRSKKNSGDYHSEINAETFEEWLKDMLLALDKPSLIILDNVSYQSRLHGKQPTTAWKKSELQNWLRGNILYFDLDTKNSLLQICRANYKEKVCEMDCIIREAGHEILTLPPYHCQTKNAEKF